MKYEIPEHVAIIMDGNRRWAAERKLDPTEGHQAGVEALEKVVKAAARMGIQYLTVYALSTENLKERSKFEITILFSLIKQGLKEKLPALAENGVHIRFLGAINRLPTDVRRTLGEFEEALSKNKKLYLNVALNYGGRDEIVQAVRKVDKPAREVEADDIEQNLYTTDLPDPELIIRTGGQQRLSNFLLWQSSYAELVFTDIYWPDFNEGHLQKILEEYSERKRNFGK